MGHPLNFNSGEAVCRSFDPGAEPESVESVVCALAHRPGFVALESLFRGARGGRFSIIACAPLKVLCCYDGDGTDPFAALQTPVAGQVALQAPGNVPFFGGWIGYLAYEAGRLLEHLPQSTACDLGLPVAWFGFYDAAAVYDHVERQWHVVGIALGDRHKRALLQERLDEYHAVISAACAAPSRELVPGVLATVDLDFDRALHRDNVRRILRYIRAGDIYQANLTYRFEVAAAMSSLELYRRLRRTNRGDYAAYLSCGGFEVLCSSPELFLDVHDRQVVTRPIKGTRPRSTDPVQDHCFKAELCNSEKDLAELAMIVDLERNDLGRVCDNITTSWPPVVESFDTVHHLVAEVRGTLQRERSVVDLLRAAFPGGSITGCPKIRAMEIIDELEPVARGPYCGAIGYLCPSGALTMNIAIRTMIAKDGKVYLHAGGGIVADSDPDDEYDEVLAKARGMLAALGLGYGLQDRPPTGSFVATGPGDNRVSGLGSSPLLHH